MKQLFIITLFMFFLVLKAQSQEPYEYPYNPIMAMSADGQIIAISGRSVDDSSTYKGFRVPIDFYATSTGELIGSFDGTDSIVNGLALNSDGSLLAYQNDSGRIAVVELATSTEINLINAGGVYYDTISPLFPPDDSLIAVSDVSSIALFTAMPPLNYLASFRQDSMTNLAGFGWSDNSNIVVLSGRSDENENGVLAIFELDTEFESVFIKTIEAPAAATVAVNDDGTAIAINTREGVLVTNVEDESQFLLPKTDLENPNLSIDWNSDGTKLVVGGHLTVDIWDIQTSEIIQTITTESSVLSVFFSPDDEHIYHTGGLAGIYRDGLPLQEAIAIEDGD